MTNFAEWLNCNLEDCDYNDVYDLYHAADEGCTFGIFEANKNEKGQVFIKNTCVETPSLAILSEEAKRTFLRMIEESYCEEMDIEGYYYFHRQMDKED